MYVCMYITYVCMCICLYVRTYVCIYVCIDTLHSKPDSKNTDSDHLQCHAHAFLFDYDFDILIRMLDMTHCTHVAVCVSFILVSVTCVLFFLSPYV